MITFQSKYYDTESGLYYYYNRYYDPNTGRFTTEDPIGIAGGLNLYRAFGNNPVSYVDPWGLMIWIQGYNAPHSGTNSNILLDLNKLLDIWIFMSEGVRNEIIKGNRKTDECYWDCVNRCMKKRGIDFDLSNILGMLGNFSFVPKKIGYNFSNFWHGGRSFYYWANQYGSGIKATTWAQAGVLGGWLSVIGAGTSAYTVSGVLFCYGTCLHGDGK